VWIKDKFGNPINMDTAGSLFVASNSDGGYEVKANTPDGTLCGQFLVGTGPVSEADATALLGRMATLLGTEDLTL
jgi:hypothetical protein